MIRKPGPVLRGSDETASSHPVPVQGNALLPGWVPPLFYAILSACFLWRCLFAGEAFLPARLLQHVAPFAPTSSMANVPPWNPLRWDGIAQFYPWRHFAANTLHAGWIPLWNPFQFCGTPFVANSQSAVLYPGNILFYLLPTATAFGFSALLHLTLCGWFTYLFARRLRCTEGAALLAGVIYSYSAWQVSWLQLPTFLATSCWFPLLLRQILVLRTTGQQRPSLCHVAGLGGVVGLMLLAGHLQIAFYGLLVGSLLAITLLIASTKANGIPTTLRTLATYVAALTLGFMLAAPQVLPSLELSRMSHRVGTPTATGYTAYAEYALPLHSLVTLSLPEFFGGDTDTDAPYWNFYLKRLSDGSQMPVRHNAAETAIYVGLVTLILGMLALANLKAPWQAGRLDRRTLFFAGLALLALLLALGTPLNALFYFGIPGFGQSGSPARCLVLWTLAWSLLAALGLDSRLKQVPTQKVALGAVLATAFVVAIGFSLVATAIKQPLPDPKIPTFRDALSHIGPGWIRLLLAGTVGTLLVVPLRMRKTSDAAPPAHRLPLRSAAALLAVIAELFATGIAQNPTAPYSEIYPETPGIGYLRKHVGHERIFPVNQRWSLYHSPPAVLPPNGATVYGLRDVQGYDSLLTGQYKAWANRFARPNQQGLLDASPPEVGNMVFFQDPNNPLVPLTGTAFAVTPSPSSPAFAPEAIPSGSQVYESDGEMAIYGLTNARPRAALDAANSAPVTWEQDDATRVSLHIDTPVACHLNLADQFYPGWHAYLDGRETPITRQKAAPVYRSVAVPAGPHQLAFRYEPMSYHCGLYLALFALMLLTVMTALPRIPRHDNP